VTCTFLGSKTWEKRFDLRLPGRLFASGFDVSEPVNLSDAESFGALALASHRSVTSRLEHIGLAVHRVEPLGVDMHGTPIVAESNTVVIPFPVANHRARRDVRVEGRRIELSPGARLVDMVSLPVRAFEVLLDADAPQALARPVRFGVDAVTRSELPRSWEIAPDAFSGRAHVRKIALTPPDTRDARLFADVQGEGVLRVHELSATDACALRGYENPRPLANGLFLYENPHALSRAYTVSRTIPLDDPVVIRRELIEWRPEDLGTRAVVSSTASIPEHLDRGIVESASFGQRASEIVVQANGASTLLVVNDRFDPDWRATIDGAAAPILEVNGLVRGVIVPEGRHRVRMEYRIPASVWAGALLSILGVVLAFFAPSVVRRLATNAGH
jgi:hypothetical protein